MFATRQPRHELPGVSLCQVWTEDTKPAPRRISQGLSGSPRLECAEDAVRSRVACDDPDLCSCPSPIDGLSQALQQKHRRNRVGWWRPLGRLSEGESRT